MEPRIQYSKDQSCKTMTLYAGVAAIYLLDGISYAWLDPRIRYAQET